MILINEIRTNNQFIKEMIRTDDKINYGLRFSNFVVLGDSYYYTLDEMR